MQETWVQSLGWEDSPGEGKGSPLQYSGLESSMDCIVRGVAKSRTDWATFTSLTLTVQVNSYYTYPSEHEGVCRPGPQLTYRPCGVSPRSTWADLHTNVMLPRGWRHTVRESSPTPAPLSLVLIAPHAPCFPCKKSLISFRHTHMRLSAMENSQLQGDRFLAQAD